MMAKTPNEVTWTTKDGRKVTVTKEEFQESMAGVSSMIERARKKLRAEKTKPLDTPQAE